MPILCVVALLSNERWSDLRLAADVLGRMGNARAIPPLVARANHPDERVRLAIIDALARFRDKRVVDGLRQLLNHPSPRTRAHAGKALAGRHSGAIAMPLLTRSGSGKGSHGADGAASGARRN